MPVLQRSPTVTQSSYPQVLIVDDICCVLLCSLMFHSVLFMFAPWQIQRQGLTLYIVYKGTWVTRDDPHGFVPCSPCARLGQERRRLAVRPLTGKVYRRIGLKRGTTTKQSKEKHTTTISAIQTPLISHLGFMHWADVISTRFVRWTYGNSLE